METQINFYPVIVSKIKLSKRTMKLTNLVTYEELLAAKPTLFKKFTESQIDDVIREVYNGKLTDTQLLNMNKLSFDEKREHAIAALSVIYELKQDFERPDADSKLTNAFSLFMSARVNVGNNESTKTAFQTADVASTDALNITEGVDLFEMFKKEGKFIYIFRKTDFTPEVDKATGHVTSIPKRMGKEGDYLTKDGKLLFMHTQLSVAENLTAEQIDELYERHYEAEQANAKEFKHDDNAALDASKIPAATRKQDAFGNNLGEFTDEYQEWLQITCATQLKLQTQAV